MIIAIVGIGLLAAAYSIWKPEPVFYYWPTSKVVLFWLLFFSGLFAFMWGAMDWLQYL